MKLTGRQENQPLQDVSNAHSKIGRKTNTYYIQKCDSETFTKGLHWSVQA